MQCSPKRCSIRAAYVDEGSPDVLYWKVQSPEHTAVTFFPWYLYNSMRHHRPNGVKGSNSLCHCGSLSDAMGGDIFRVLSQELYNLKCQLEICPSTTWEITAELNAQVLEMLGYLDSIAAKQNDFLLCLRKQWKLLKLSYWEIQFVVKEKKII